ncbi:unnamed protein product [Callosobruchus maculatus]|uniref:C2H2-type domain-containing protein n=1 Tax=Callosobruchus maculatus TaxID=64391 RepID=A0A653DL61_CALMS|nr:unnamed protein product [Callosobruchus maculatus]
MIAEYEDDAHFCLKCHTTIIGLDNYVDHRKTGCSRTPKSPLPSQLLQPDDSFGPKADDFFSSLELRSSSKKNEGHPSTSGKSITGILTRSKTTAVIQATSSSSKEPDPPQSKSGKNVWIGGHQLKELGHGDNESKLIKAVANLERRKEEPTRLQVYDESEDDSDDYDYEVDESSSDDQDRPPRNYTGGKWKPSSPIQWSRNDWNVPPPSYTGGKWKPPPTHTKGKWKPSYTKEDDIPPPTFTGSKWISSKKQDEGLDVPPPTFTGSKWVSSKKQDYQEIPPPNHTKGKWKPRSEDDDYPPPNHTKGKWKPVDFPPPSHTKGKWKPKDDLELPIPLEPEKAQDMVKESKSTEEDNWITPSTSKDISIMDQSTTKSNDTNQYWCGLCNRKLSSKVVYERHLKSELHFKRMVHDLDFDDNSILTSKRRTKIAPPEVIFSNQKKTTAKNERKRARKKIYERCEVCHSKVYAHLIGKHLISHYHCRRGDITSATAKCMVLKNIHEVVLESPFQCSICKFYCNTHEDFLTHWLSQGHIDNGKPGYFFCSFCSHRSEDTKQMHEHLISPGHMEVVSVINRYIPIVIKKINPIYCSTCNKEFSLNIQMLQHCKKLNHGQEEELRKLRAVNLCDECGENFVSSVSLQRHKESAHGEKYYFCTPCNIKLKSKKEIRDHRNTQDHLYNYMEKKGKSKRKDCDYCDESFGNYLLLKKHLREVHPEYQIRCGLCGTIFAVAAELAAHIRRKACKFPTNDEDTIQCKRCPFKASSKAELYFHGVFHDEEPVTFAVGDGEKVVSKYQCPLCSKMFTKASLLPHIRQHTKEKPFECKICGKKFARKNNLNFHVRNHKNDYKKKSKEQIFLCSVCGDSFNRRSILQQHMLRHTGKPFKCPSVGCLYSARSSAEVKAHFSTHLEEKNFKCDICKFTTKTKQLLQRHSRTHSERRHQCPKCSFAAITASHLRRHIRKHTGAKPFKCPYCEYTCSTLENLRKHILITTKHIGKSVYECKLCTSEVEEKFQSNVAKDFRAHLLTRHSDMFANSVEAINYVAGLYNVQDEATLVTEDFDTHESTSKSPPAAMEEQNENILKLNSDIDPVVSQLPTTSSNKDNLDQMFTMYIIPKEDGISVENPGESWNLVGRYDVEEESGTLIPFQSEEDSLFDEHF